MVVCIDDKTTLPRLLSIFVHVKLRLLCGWGSSIISLTCAACCDLLGDRICYGKFNKQRIDSKLKLSYTLKPYLSLPCIMKNYRTGSTFTEKRKTFLSCFYLWDTSDL